MPAALKVEPREFPITETAGGRRIYPWDKLSIGDWFVVDTYNSYKDKGPGKMLGVFASMCREKNKANRRFMPTMNGDSGVKIHRIK